MEHVASVDAPSGCFLCLDDDVGADAERLIVRRGKGAFVILNRFPYNNGHVMVVPRAHVARPEDLGAAGWASLAALLSQTIAILREAYGPDGLNLGMNLGSAAGAGVADHIHWHVVPRWEGDTNFMPVLADTKVIPQHLSETREDLATRFASANQEPE
jgi:ATP adenylyltransferase